MLVCIHDRTELAICLSSSESKATLVRSGTSGQDVYLGCSLVHCSPTRLVTPVIFMILDLAFSRIGATSSISARSGLAAEADDSLDGDDFDLPVNVRDGEIVRAEDSRLNLQVTERRHATETIVDRVLNGHLVKGVTVGQRNTLPEQTTRHKTASEAGSGNENEFASIIRLDVHRRSEMTWSNQKGAGQK